MSFMEDALRVPETSTPPTPAPLSHALYPKPDEKWYTRDSDGNEAPVGASSRMAGEITITAAATADAGWLLCDGTSYPTATYPALFARIGYTYGGAGANFNVPNLSGRVVVGVGTATGAPGAINHPLAQQGGEETHTLTSAEIPAHTHPATSGTQSANHTHSGTTGGQSNGHAHRAGDGTNGLLQGGGVGVGANITTGGGGYVSGDSSGPTADHTHNFVSGTESASHTHAITVNNNTGGGGAHNTMQPFIALNYQIKT